MVAPLLVEFVKKRLAEKKSLKEIEEELKKTGYTEAETLEAIDNATPEPKKTITISPVLTIFLIVIAIFLLAVIPVFFGRSVNLLLIIASTTLFLKALLYAFVFNVLLLMTEYSTRTPFRRCFNVGMYVAIVGLITIPFVKYGILVFSLILLVLFFKTATFKTYFLFLVFIIFVEIFSGLGLIYIEAALAGESLDDISLTTQRYCTLHKDQDKWQGQFIQTNSGRRHDYCMNVTYDRVNECEENCWVMEYSCLFFDIQKERMPCPGPCNNGGCIQ